jgi:predicted dehydrogenase
MAMQAINVGMIGYKFMGKAHSHALFDVNFFFDLDFYPVRKVICGRHLEPLKAAAERWGWEECETSWEKVVQRDDLQVIDICTSTNTHCDIAILAAENKKHIFCEKPLAMNVQEAKKMVEAVEKAGVKHMVGFNYRRVPAIAYAKKLIEAGKIGKIYHFRAAYLQDWIVDPDFPLIWKLRKEIAGSGPHGDLNSHMVDLAHYLVGDIESVMCMTTQFIKYRKLPAEEKELSTMLTARSGEGMGEVNVEDASFFVATFANGALGSFEATRFAPGRKNYNYFEIYGSEGSLVFNFERMNELQYFSRGDETGNQGFKTILVTEEVHPYISAWWPPGHIIGYEHTFIHEFADFFRSLASDTLPQPNFYDGLKCQAVLDAALLSAAEGRRVSVQEVLG